MSVDETSVAAFVCVYKCIVPGLALNLCGRGGVGVRGGRGEAGAGAAEDVLARLDPHSQKMGTWALRVITLGVNTSSVRQI